MIGSVDIKALIAARQKADSLKNGFPKANYFIIGGTRSPGKATLVEAKKVFGWHINHAAGLSGATVQQTGDELWRPSSSSKSGTQTTSLIGTISRNGSYPRPSSRSPAASLRWRSGFSTRASTGRR